MATVMAGRFPIYALGGPSSGDSYAFDWLSDSSIKVALLSSALSFDQDNHKFWSDISANEISGTGYTAGGQALSGKTITYDTVTNDNEFGASTSSWATATITSRYAAVYKDSGVGSTSVLIAIFDFGSNKSSSNGTFSVIWDSGGVIVFTPA